MMKYRHLDATDLPRDPNGSLGKLRSVLTAAFNSSRDREDRMDLLARTLHSVLDEIEQTEDLNDRIEQLTELVSTQATKIRSMTKEIAKLTKTKGK